MTLFISLFTSVPARKLPGGQSAVKALAAALALLAAGKTGRRRGCRVPLSKNRMQPAAPQMLSTV